MIMQMILAVSFVLHDARRQNILKPKTIEFPTL